MKANRKFVEGREAVSAVIGVILMVAITVAIAAAVYVYLGGILPSGGANVPESASVIPKAVDSNTIHITLTGAGEHYGDGYKTNNTYVTVDGKRFNLTDPEFQDTDGDDAWDVGEYFEITNTSVPSIKSGAKIHVTAVVYGTVVADKVIHMP